MGRGIHRSKTAAIILLAVASISPPQEAASQSPAGRPSAGTQSAGNFPGAEWERRTPAQVGMNEQRLNQAIQVAVENEEVITRDLRRAIELLRLNNEDTHREPLGPFKDREGGVTGVVIRHGFLIAEWGEPEAVNMTFSVTKSFISTAFGLALDRGLIRDPHDRVSDYVRGQDGFGDFADEHNRKITWDHMLRMQSEWVGTLWGKPHTAEGRREPRDLPPQEPGTYYMYSNIAAARLALALMQVTRQPLPLLIKEGIMDPIGASNTWRWKGYDDAWVTIDGIQMQASSSGGGYGGALWISALDQARFGLLSLHRGVWNGQRLLSERFFEHAETPGLRRSYGFMNWSLNTDGELMPGAPESAFYHSGYGVNRIYVDRENDLVVVVRWIQGDAFDEFISEILASIEEAEGARN